MSAAAVVRWGELEGLDQGGFERLLSPEERSRAAALMSDRARQRFITARGLLRTLLGERLGRDPKTIELVYGERGKPRLADGSPLRFNLSHSHGLVALAFCEDGEVGVDVEAVREGLSIERIARRYLPQSAVRRVAGDDERPLEFFRAWARQEAYAKARGTGLQGIGESPDPRLWTITDLDLRDGYAAAVAIEGPGPVEVTTSELSTQPVIG